MPAILASYPKERNTLFGSERLYPPFPSFESFRDSFENALAARNEQLADSLERMRDVPPAGATVKRKRTELRIDDGPAVVMFFRTMRVGEGDLRDIKQALRSAGDFKNTNIVVEVIDPDRFERGGRFG